MSDRIAWFISGACLSALLLTTTGFKTVPDGPGPLGAADSFVTVMEDLPKGEEKLLYTVPEGFVLCLTDWSFYWHDINSLTAIYPDSTESNLGHYWAPKYSTAGTEKKILRTGVALPAGTELVALQTYRDGDRVACTGQLYRE